VRAVPAAAAVGPADRSADPGGGSARAGAAVGGRDAAPAPAALLDAGVQVRLAAAVSASFVVVDRTTAAVAIDPAHPYGATLLTHAPGIVGTLVAAFQRYWSLASPAGRGPGPRSTAEAEVLHCLADGMTDDSIARQLGICSRTVGRHVTRMMDVLGARSRFELGLRARQAGWLE
jgi:DNA-binding NarL/FixJ family response regulator